MSICAWKGEIHFMYSICFTMVIRICTVQSRLCDRKLVMSVFVGKTSQKG